MPFLSNLQIEAMAARAVAKALSGRNQSAQGMR